MSTCIHIKEYWCKIVSGLGLILDVKIEAKSVVFLLGLPTPNITGILILILCVFFYLVFLFAAKPNAPLGTYIKLKLKLKLVKEDFVIYLHLLP